MDSFGPISGISGGRGWVGERLGLPRNCDYAGFVAESRGPSTPSLFPSDAFRNYAHQRRGGQWIDFPADGHPEEDLMDALRGGQRDALHEN
jgi:hypothetical protein